MDKLANRCLAQGTNAWTDVDHTAYTVSQRRVSHFFRRSVLHEMLYLKVTCAGAEAFLNLLPIYLDHILNPTLTAEGFTTEVHHVTAQGEDKGVVYCEMQVR